MKSIKKPMGRPPPEWMKVFASKSLESDLLLTRIEAGKFLNTTSESFYRFCERIEFTGEYRKVRGAVKTYYSMKAFQEAVKQYIASRSV